MLVSDVNNIQKKSIDTNGGHFKYFTKRCLILYWLTSIVLVHSTY